MKPRPTTTPPDGPPMVGAPTPLTLDGPVPPAQFAIGTSEIRTVRTEEVSADHASELVALEAAFDRCLAALSMHFQPIVRPDRTLFGYEALLRSKDKTLPHPGAILDAAERLCRVDKLGRAVRNQVGRVVAAGGEERGSIFINLHALDLFDRTLTSPFSPLTKVARRIVLEVTERASLDGMADIRYRIAELREVGFRIAVDDLGAGEARMTHLTPLDTDFVKLDMSLVRDIDSHPVKRQLCKAITTLCRDQGITVIGEGVETQAENDTLVELGCDLLQGYLIARPAPPFVSVG
jgi:EAL domain-containing protein (putative c-di-GMP-specific phosphodiesterase class I)